MKVKCKSIKVDVPTVNNRIYPKESMLKALEEYNNKPNNLGLFHPNYDETWRDSFGANLLDDVSHRVVNSSLDDDGFVVADIQVLQTPKGKLLQQIIDTKLDLNLMMSFYGEINDDGIVSNIKINSADVTIDSEEKS